MRTRVYQITLKTPHDDGSFDDDDVEEFIHTALSSEPGMYPPDDPKSRIRLETVERIK